MASSSAPPPLTSQPFLSSGTANKTKQKQWLLRAGVCLATKNNSFRRLRYLTNGETWPSAGCGQQPRQTKHHKAGWHARPRHVLAAFPIGLAGRTHAPDADQTMASVM